MSQNKKIKSRISLQYQCICCGKMNDVQMLSVERTGQRCQTILLKTFDFSMCYTFSHRIELFSLFFSQEEVHVMFCLHKINWDYAPPFSHYCHSIFARKIRWTHNVLQEFTNHKICHSNTL